MSYLRLTGPVETMNEVPWSTKDGSRSGTMPKAVIRLNEFITTEVTVADSIKDSVRQGETVDLIVNVEANGGYVRSTATGFWPRALGSAA